MNFSDTLKSKAAMLRDKKQAAMRRVASLQEKIESYDSDLAALHRTAALMGIDDTEFDAVANAGGQVQPRPSRKRSSGLAAAIRQVVRGFDKTFTSRDVERALLVQFPDVWNATRHKSSIAGTLGTMARRGDIQVLKVGRGRAMSEYVRKGVGDQTATEDS